jgi:hypothetical protein
MSAVSPCKRRKERGRREGERRERGGRGRGERREGGGREEGGRATEADEEEVAENRKVLYTFICMYMKVYKHILDSIMRSLILSC